MCVHHVFSSHSSVDGDLGWFHTWTIVNSAAMKAFVHVSLWCASPGVLVSTQVFYLQADSHSDRTLCAHQQCTWAALPLIPTSVCCHFLSDIHSELCANLKLLWSACPQGCWMAFRYWLAICISIIWELSIRIISLFIDWIIWIWRISYVCAVLFFVLYGC